jgi:hypothetical protein
VTPEDRRDDLVARLDAAVARLHAHAVATGHEGLTGADATTGERWEAGQVWAHVGEFGHYWLGELDLVVGMARDDPVPFGRTKRDPGRIAAIEAGRREIVAAHLARVDEAAAGLRHRMASYGPADWSRVGRHETLGLMDVARIIDEFLVGHYEEHAAQLDELVAP